MHRHLSLQGTLVLIAAALLLSACGPQVAATLDVTEPPPVTEVKPTDAPTPTVTPEPTATPLPRHARITGLKGTVQVQAAGAASFSDAAVDQLLFAGDSMQTGEDGEAVLEMDDQTILVVAPNSSFTVTALDGTPQNPITRFFMNLGQIFSIRGEELPEGSTYEIETPQGVALIRGSAMGARLTPEGRLEVTCLIGHCGAVIGGILIELNSGESCVVEEQVPEVTPMDAGQQQEWAGAVDAAEEAGADVDDGLEKDRCQCEGNNYVCTDGTTIQNFAECIRGPRCQCDGTTLMCGDQRSENDPACASGTAERCRCRGAHLHCDDGSVIYTSPACTGEALCYCSGADLVCGDITYGSDPACATVDTSACTCENGFMYCPDGSTYFNSAACPSDLPCVCQGTTFVCTFEGQTVSYPNYPLCGGSGLTCVCVEGFLYCEDGTIGSC